MIDQCTQDQFMKDVANHDFFLRLDQGIYRHLVFEQSEHRFLHRFEIITTPHRLMVTGDVGTWVFSRLEDMFEFFRTDKGSINESYWAEKVINGQSGGRSETKVYDGDAYKERLMERIDEYDLEDDQKSEVIEELNSLDFNDEHRIISEISDFNVSFTGSSRLEGFTFQDVWEIDMKVYSYHFIWCCYAIAWGIQQYDKLERA